MRTNLTLLNYTWPTNSTNIWDLFTYADSAVDNTMFPLLIIMIFGITFGLLSRWNTRVALLGAGFVTFIIVVLFASQGVIGDDYVILSLFGLGIIVAYNFFKGR